MNSNYSITAEIIERQIKELEEKVLGGDKAHVADLYKKIFLLAHLYAWKLDRREDALLEYQKAAKLRQSSEQIKNAPPIEFLFIAEIYEKKNDITKAREYYQNLLKGLIAAQEKESDDVSVIMGDELIRLVKYQIDSIDFKNRAIKDFKPLLSKLKLSSGAASLPFAHLLPSLLVPTAEYDFAIAMKGDLVSYMKQSPANISSMILNYYIILNTSASSVDEFSEKAMEEYMSKYPEGYYSLSLGYMFHKFYKENGQDEKANRLLKRLEKIASERGIELITGPEKRFSSPEMTWETYKKALREGDIDTAMECYIPGRWRHKQVYRILGKERMKEIGKEMGDIRRVDGDDRMANYEIIRKENGKAYSYGILFYNIDGEWKIQEF